MKKHLDNNTRPYQFVRNLQEQGVEDITLETRVNSLLQRYPANLMFIEQSLRADGKQVHREVIGDAAPPPPDKHDDKEKQSDGEDTKPVIKNKSHTRSISPKKVLISVGIVVLLLLLSGSAYAYYYLPRGTVTLFVTEDVLEHSSSVVVDTGVQDVLGDEGVIPGRVVRVEVEETGTFDATGTKEVGEKAQGTVEIRNFTSSSISLGAGTLLTTSNGGESLTYELDKSVTIPAATESNPDPNTRVSEAGVAEATITATQIGAKYNIAANKSLTVDDLDTDDIFAANTTPLSGGSTEEIAVITDDDHNKAIQQLKEAATAKAQGQLRDEIGEGQSFEDETIKTATLFANFTHEVGATVNEFGATTKVAASTIVYSEEALKGVLKRDIQNNVPEGFEISAEDEILNIESVTEESENTLAITAKISSYVVPIIDTNSLDDQLKGQSLKDGEALLRDIENVQGYDIRLWPNLPGPLRRFPSIDDRLEIVTETASDAVNTESNE